jgi:uncharacterized membrane protein YkoI
MRAGPLIPILAALLSILTPVAHAQSLVDRSRQEQPQIEAGISLDQAVAMAERRYRAKAVRADTVSNNGRVVYQIRLLGPDGKVWTVHVDAQSGTMN